MKPLQPLHLSPIITFGFVGILTLAAGAWWKDRLRLVAEIERLQWQMSYPIQPKMKPRELDGGSQLVSYADRSGHSPRS